MKLLRRLRLGLEMLPWLLALSRAAHLAAAHASVTGAVFGRVQNVATGQYLNNARVSVRFGPDTPGYARRYRVTAYGTQLSAGVRGTF